MTRRLRPETVLLKVTHCGHTWVPYGLSRHILVALRMLPETTAFGTTRCKECKTMLTQTVGDVLRSAEP